MTLMQLMSDIGALFGTIALTAGLPLVARVIVTVFVMLATLLLLHLKVSGYTMVYWLYLLVRTRFLPTRTVFRLQSETQARGEPSSVQESWIQLHTLHHGAAGIQRPRKQAQTSEFQYWSVFEIASQQQIRLLSEADQVRLFTRFKQFLDGLGFPLKFLTLVQSADPDRDPALLVQKRVLDDLQSTPHLRALQVASLQHQQQSLPHCTTIKHFVVVSASNGELARLRPDGTRPSQLVWLIGLVTPQKQPAITSLQVLRELSNRVSVVKKALSHLDVQATHLDDASFLQAYTSCLALGTHVPSFVVESFAETPPSRLSQAKEGNAALLLGKNADVTRSSPASNGPTKPAQTARTTAGPPMRHWKRHIRGLHQSFSFESKAPRPRLDEVVRLCDLIAPASVTLLKDAVEVTAQGATRYHRYYEVLSFAPDLHCGWPEEMTSLGCPGVYEYEVIPIDSRMMIKRLELHMTKLESQFLADQNARKRTKADQKIEAEQVKSVIDALARKKLQIFSVQMIIGIHAGDRGRLEQRANFLLSHLRDLQLRVRPLTRRHDIAWQATLPTPLAKLDTFINLPSDVLSTFMNWSNGTVGTVTGAYIGTTGTGLSQRPVYFNPWDEHKRLANPHVVICGESGMGKSWLAKTLIMGLLSSRIADAVVLDRDGDYDAIHAYLRGESQRCDLAGTCPINLLDIPYGPGDVRLDDPSDLIAEFIDNHLLIGLALLYGEALSKPQESFLTHAARSAYAAKGITIDAIRRDPQTLLLDPPVFSDLLDAMRTTPASSEAVRAELLERFETIAYLFPGQTTIGINCPLTIFNINKLDEKWYPLMIYVVQTFLTRHRALRRHDRYLAYVVEEASYLLKHPAGRRYLESGSRGFRKLGIAQFTLSQHPADFLEDGAVIIGNAGTAFFLGMQRHTAQKLKLAEELERALEEGVSGQAVMRCGREYAQITVARQSSLHRALFTTDPRERRLLQQQQQKARQRQEVAS